MCSICGQPAFQKCPPWSMSCVSCSNVLGDMASPKQPQPWWGIQVNAMTATVSLPVATHPLPIYCIPCTVGVRWGWRGGLQVNVMTATFSLPVASHPLPLIYTVCHCAWVEGAKLSSSN